jgi:hypothetical protein
MQFSCLTTSCSSLSFLRTKRADLIHRILCSQTSLRDLNLVISTNCLDLDYSHNKTALIMVCKITTYGCSSFCRELHPLTVLLNHRIKLQETRCLISNRLSLINCPKTSNKIIATPVSYRKGIYLTSFLTWV